MIFRSGRRAFNRLRSQQFPTEPDHHIPGVASVLNASRLIAEADLEPATRLPDLTGRRARPAGVWLIAAAVAVILLVVGTVTATRGTSGPAGIPAAPTDQGLSTSQVLSVWERALHTTPHPLIIVGYGGTTQIGSWEPRNGDNKQALLSRVATLATDITKTGTTGPTNGTVTFANGTTRAVTLLDAQSTARLLITESGSPQPCDGCTPVVLTNPKRTTASVKTATGPATVPAWSFGVQGSAVRLVQASIDPAELLQTVPGLPYGLGDAEFTVHVESNGQLTVRWTGSPSVAQAGGCGRDYRPVFAEGTDVVVLGFVELPSTATETPQACNADASSRTATVWPPHPLGARILVQDRSGFVVPRV